MNDTTKSKPAVEPPSKATIATIPVVDDQVHAIGYDAATSRLAVQFKKNGKPAAIYHYGNVSQHLFDAFLASQVPRRYFDEHVRPNPAQYPYVRVS